MAMESKYIWMDGEFVPFEKATVHALSPTIHYGPGAFEGIRCYVTNKGPGVFRLREHMERFRSSIHILGMECPYTVEELIEATHETIRKNDFEECYIRPFMYLEGPLGLNLDASEVRISIATWLWGPYLGEEALEQGAKAIVSSFTRMHHNSSMTKAKIGGQYVNSMLAKTLATRQGFDEAILLDPDGYVAECSGENIFLVRGDKVYTPNKANILEGITRESVMTLCEDLGYEVIEEPISRDQLYIADEIFISGTAAEVTPISEVDYRKIGAGKRGPVTHKVQNLFFETTHGKGARSDEWISMVGNLKKVQS
ncbi:MAG: branched-chain amino acid transaminase [Anaerolineae bacterium]|nr:branched-chain amino acid transaminase [Anaerolineae bacterium]